MSIKPCLIAASLQPRACAVVILLICISGETWAVKARPTDPQKQLGAIDDMAHRLATELGETEVRTIAVFDLRDPNGNWLPFGSWLADQISVALANMDDRIAVVDRARLAIKVPGRQTSPGRNTEARTAESLGADGFIVGSVGELRGQIGVTIVGYRVSDVNSDGRSRWFSMINGRILVDGELAAHLGVPLSALRPNDGVYKAGTAGLTVPECEYCPPPQYSPVAIAEKKQGTIGLSIVVTPDGHATEIKVVRGSDARLDSEAVRAVGSYMFKPALDPGGQPIAARMPFTLDFQTTNK